MNAAFDILNRARQHRFSITPAGRRLKLRAERKPPDGLLAKLRAHKAEILAILSGETWAEEHEERAAQAEFDGGIPRVWGGRTGAARSVASTCRCPASAMAAVHRRLRSVRRRMGVAGFPARMDAACAVRVRPHQAFRPT